MEPGGVRKLMSHPARPCAGTEDPGITAVQTGGLIL